MVDSGEPSDGEDERYQNNNQIVETDAAQERIDGLESENKKLQDRLATVEKAVTEIVDTLEVDDENKSSGSEGGGISRRGALAALASAGVIGAASQPASGHHDPHNHLGGSWSGSTSSGTGLSVSETSGSTKTTGVSGTVDSSTDQSRGVYGKATAASGNVQGVVGEIESTTDNATALIGHAFGATGRTIGLLGLNDSTEGRGLVGYTTPDSGNTIGLLGKVDSPSGTAVRGQHTATSGVTYAVEGTVESSDGYGIYTPDDAKVDGTLEVLGDIQVDGVKNFVQTVSGDAGPKQITYTSVEAGEPQTEHSDVTEMEDGVAVVELPDHFGMVTSDDERLAVQVTPYCDEPVKPQVTDRSTDHIVVKDFGDGPDEYSFAYTVKGVRQGFEDHEIVSDSP